MASLNTGFQVRTFMLGIEPSDELCAACFLPALQVATAAMTAFDGPAIGLPWGVVQVVRCADCGWQR